VLVVIPTIFILVIVHFVVKGGQAKARAEIAKLMPVEEKVRKPSRIRFIT